MATNPDRTSHFPAIEKKHGEPVSHWLEMLAEIRDRGYNAQMTLLQSEHGFSRTHANALVMYSRGSASSRRFDSLDDYLAAHDEAAAGTVRGIFAALQEGFPDTDVVISWNHPMLKKGDRYLFGASVHQGHVLIAPFDASILPQFADRLADYHVNKKTVRVPLDWEVDADLLCDMVAAQVP